MVIKPIEFAMIQQQNTVSQMQHSAENKAMTEQQNISAFVEKESNNKSEQVRDKDNVANDSQGKFDAKEKSNNEYNPEYAGGRKNNNKSDGRFFIKGQGSMDFDIKV